VRQLRLPTPGHAALQPRYRARYRFPFT
jgi:hypothetical protein